MYGYNIKIHIFMIQKENISKNFLNNSMFANKNVYLFWDIETIRKIVLFVFTINVDTDNNNINQQQE